jgi:hypothetical protein
MTGSRKPDEAELRARLTDEQYRVTLGPPRARFRRRPAGEKMTHRLTAHRPVGRIVWLLFAGAVAGCGSTAPSETVATAPAAPVAPAQPDVAQLIVSDLSPGTGAEAQAGSVVTVHYTGWLYDPKAVETKGKKFDSSRDAGQPFQFPLGAGRVIAGWDQGVAGMRVGGQRRLVIPSTLGYGQRGAGGVIPPGAALVFDVELLDVRAGAG